MTDGVVQRAEVLIQQQKYAEAEKLLKSILPGNPDNVHVLALLAEVHLQLRNTNEADVLINRAIGLSPDVGYLFYIKSRVHIQQENYDAAEENLEQALVLDPEDADYYAFWASVKLARKQYEQALELANRALQLEPENILGLNTRSTALLKLKKHDESFRTIEGALKEDPNNAYTHANYGWNLLEKGNHKKALEHFREALKNDPDNQYAQAGMMQALKASNLVYRLFLKYSFWIGNLTAKYQWGVIIGFYVGTRVLRAVANNNPSLQPYLTPLIILLAIIAFSTWVISPISNLFLRLNAYGRHLLDEKEIRSSNFVGISFLLFLVGALSSLIASDERFLTVAVFGFTMMLPFSVMFSPSRYKYSLVIYAAAMALVGAGAIAITFSTGELFNTLTPIYIFGFIAFQWVANFLLIKQGNI